LGVAIVFGTRLIGLALAYAIYTFGSTQLYNQALNRIPSDFGWMYLCMTLFSLLPALQTVLYCFDARWEVDFGVPDQQIFQVTGPNYYDKSNQYVRLVRDGPLGRFNRAQRAYFNTLEFLPCLVGHALCSGVVFPFPTFVVVVGFFLSRMLYTHGYTNSKAGRLPGFVLSADLFVPLLEGLTLLAALLLLRR